MSATKKKVLAQPKCPDGKLAKALSISLYPKHFDVMALREQELNMNRSILIQLLLDIEFRDGLLRQELIRRLSTVKPDATPATKGNPS